MATLNINLLPDNLKAGGKDTKLKKLINNGLVISASLLIVASFLSSIGLFAFSLQLTAKEKTLAQLEASVKAFQETEQKLFLIQDRLVKIRTIQQSDTTEKSITKFKSLLTILPASAKLRESTVNSTSISMVIELPDSGSVTSFLSQIVTLDFKRINLKDFSFSAQTGYSLTIIFFVKD